jgi:hypothetical protein
VRRFLAHHLLEPHQAHHRAQPRRARRARGRHPVPQPVAGRPHRSARAEPEGAGRDHRRGDRRFGDGRQRRDPGRPRAAAAAVGRPADLAAQLLRPQPRIPDQSGARGAAAAQPDHADPDPGTHLRPGRAADPRQRQHLCARRDSRQITRRDEGTGFFLFDWWNGFMAWLPGDDFPLYQEYGADEGTRYPEVAAALTGAGHGDRARRRQAPARGLGGGADPAAARHRRRAAAVDGAGRHRPDRHRRALGHPEDRAGRGGVTILLSLLLASTIAGPLRRLSAAAEKVQPPPCGAARRSPTSRIAPTRSATSARRCAR